MHLVQPNRHPAGQQLDSYYSTKILEMCLSKWIMKLCSILKGSAENKLSVCHTQQNYILAEGDFEKKPPKTNNPPQFIN